MTPTNTDENFHAENAEKPKVWVKHRGAFMYKFMFFAFSICAVYPEWPVDAVNASHELLEGFQATLVALQDSNT